VEINKLTGCLLEDQLTPEYQFEVISIVFFVIKNVLCAICKEKMLVSVFVVVVVFKQV